MSPQAQAQLDRHIDNVEKRLPRRAAETLRRLRQPSAVFARWAAAIALIAGGLLSFLPVLGLWMLPLGLILIAQDVPILRRPLGRLLTYIERKWQAYKAR